MSYYKSNSSSSSSHYYGPSSSSSSSYYNDMYRSFTNLRSLPPSYAQPLYLSTTCPYASSYKRFSSSISPPCCAKMKAPPPSPSSSSGCCVLSRSSTCRLHTPTLPITIPITTTTVSEKVVKTTISETYSSKLGDDLITTVKQPVNLETTTTTTKKEGETIINDDSSSINNNNTTSESVDQSNEQHQEESSDNSNQQQHESAEHPPPNSNDSNDVNATAISSIRLNCTDDLTTQVDYYLNEVDNRMICRGKTIELESFELSGKSGLISKCLYLNELLTEANMSEINLESDPVFGAGDSGKCDLYFLSAKDAESFANRHSDKFTVVFTNDIEKMKLPSSPTTKKNVSFINTNESNNDNNNNNNNNSNSKSILKSNSNQLSQSKSSDSISSKATIGLGNHLRNDNSNENLNGANIEDASNLLVSANSSKKSKTEGYEILTIRAKLKQRVGHNRSKPVELHDIDSIMRNVVTIIQDEFMKRFPSGPSPNTVATASSMSN